MVMIYAFFLAFLPSVIVGLQDVQVTAGIDQPGIVNQPVKGTITVTHDKNLEIDPQSFQLEGKPLEVEFLKTVQISPDSPLILSLYTFSMEPRPAGLHMLPSVSVTIGGKTYQSISSGYEVKGQTQTPGRPTRPSARPAAPAATRGIVLDLETLLEGDTTLYPGQQITVGYRYIFNYSVDLRREEIPLLYAEGFRKIGSVEKKPYTIGDLNYLDITQKIEALKPGDYRFAPGVVAGRAYRTDRFGRRQLAKTDSSGQSTPVTLTVLPFPEKDRPPSFHGAIGQSLQMNVSLLTPDQVNVGDKIVLQIIISGEGQLSNLPMPDVCCQPGFSGFFRLSDLPPKEDIEGGTKTFTVEMRPLNDRIKAIPSLAFSYFNPINQSYTTVRSDPIPLSITPFKRQPSDVPAPGQEQLPIEDIGEETIQMPPAGAIEIEGNIPLTLSDLKNRPFGTWWVLLIIPAGLAAFFFQIQFKHYLEAKRQLVKPKQSGDLFREALREKPGSSSFFQLLREAFLLRLVEKGEINSVDVPLDKLPQTEISERVRAFLQNIEERRFSGKEGQFGEEFFQEARGLFEELQS
ncbi:MAG: hypothetical protein WB791_08580 [Waddliaceae bacterium]